jgi:hypothetical protein
MSELGGADVVERLDRFPGLSVVAFAKADQIAQLERASSSFGLTANDLTTALWTSRGVVFISRRTAQAYSFVFVARDDEAMDGMIAAFAACRLNPGVCVRIE